MLLAVDIGNTNVVFGLFRGRRLTREWRFPTASFRVPAVKTKINKVVAASVVPRLNQKLSSAIRKYFKCSPFFVSAENIPAIKIRLKNKKEIGADRVVNVLAAYKLYGGPAIVIDFGTAATFDALSAAGEYLGGAIAPGIVLARNTLYEQTAKLPKIKIAAPQKVIGKNTISALRSGLVYGYAAMVEGMVARIKSEFKGQGPRVKVIATGGLAKLVCKFAEVVDIIDPQLTLKGLALIAEGI